jgi:glutathione S-transferase
MKLYGFPPSPNTRKVQAVIATLEMPVELAVVDLGKGEQRKPEYLAINPTCRVPTLVDGDFVLWESNAIMQYLAAQRPNSLWPDDLKAQAEINSWQCWQLGHWNEGTGRLIFQRVVKPLLKIGEPDATEIKRGDELFRRDAAILDTWLAKRKFLAGNGVTLADFSIAAPLMYRKEAQMPAEGYPNLMAWYARVEAQPGWQRSQPKF